MLLSLVFAIAASSSQIDLKCLAKPVDVINAVQPIVPKGKMFPGQRVALVKVVVSATGSVTGASIVKSSGDRDLDRAAIVAANASEFNPATKNCKAVPGSYLFRTEFTAD